MPVSIVKSVLDPGAELIVRYALLDGERWHFQNAVLLSGTNGRSVASYPSANEAARLLGSELRPALSRLQAVLDRLRLQFPNALTAEARLHRMSLSYLVSHYSIHDENGAVVCQWNNPAIQQTMAEPVANKLAG
jgi:hypothetical protein